MKIPLHALEPELHTFYLKQVRVKSVNHTGVFGITVISLTLTDNGLGFCADYLIVQEFTFDSEAE